MLSYRHSFHAGNAADLLKHLVLIELLQYLQRKDAAVEYIDTHAGAGLYQLDSDESQKTGEYHSGYGAIQECDWPELETYKSLVARFNQRKQLRYPGSPLLALELLRPQDRAWLFELHPKDHQRLLLSCKNYSKVRIENSDGLKGLISLLPPASRRALVLIDPSYEVKSDYRAVVDTLQQAQRRFATGTYALWYPVVQRRQIEQLEKDLLKTGIRNIQRFELGWAPDSTEYGMTASGMIVINPTWGLMDKMQDLLPKLAHQLAGAEGNWRCDQLVAE